MDTPNYRITYIFCNGITRSAIVHQREVPNIKQSITLIDDHCENDLPKFICFNTINNKTVHIMIKYLCEITIDKIE